MVVGLYLAGANARRMGFKEGPHHALIKYNVLFTNWRLNNLSNIKRFLLNGEGALRKSPINLHLFDWLVNRALDILKKKYYNQFTLLSAACLILHNKICVTK